MKKLIKNIMLAMLIGTAIVTLINELSKAQIKEEKDIETLVGDAEEVKDEDKK